MQIIFTRHGQTDENAKGISMGQTIDGELNAAGLAEAQIIANHLKKIPIDFIYFSDLRRTTATAEAIAKFHPRAQLTPAKELRERHHGIYGGLKRGRVQQIALELSQPFESFRPPDGESYLDVQARVFEYYNQLLAKHKNDNLLIVSHVGVLAMLFIKLFELPVTPENYNRFKIKHGGLAIFETSDGQKHKIKRFDAA